MCHSPAPGVGTVSLLHESPLSLAGMCLLLEEVINDFSALALTPARLSTASVFYLLPY